MKRRDYNPSNEVMLLNHLIINKNIDNIE